MNRITSITTLASVACAFAVASASCSNANEEPKKDQPATTTPAAALPSAPAATPTTPASPSAADTAKPAGEKTAIENKPPLDVLKNYKLGTMKNPYNDDPAMIEAGKKLYFAYSCNGCHGGGGGGGMCPPLTNDTFVYGSNDDILFRLIAQGSQDMMKEHGLKRKGQEAVVGPMPPFGTLIKTDDELWKIVAFVHSLYKGSKRDW